MNNKEFVTKLSEHELRILIIAGFAHCNKDDDTIYPFPISNEEIELDVREWDNSISVGIISKRQKMRIATFNISDLKMTIYYSGCEKDLSKVLKVYLAHRYSDTYVEYVYNRKLKELEEEKEFITTEAPKFKKEYLPKGYIEEPIQFRIVK